MLNEVIRPKQSQFFGVAQLIKLIKSLEELVRTTTEQSVLVKQLNKISGVDVTNDVNKANRNLLCVLKEFNQLKLKVDSALVK